MHKPLFISLILVTGSIGTDALAADPVDYRQIALCAAIKGDLDRLECFDNLAAEHGLSRPQPQPAPVSGTGKWQISHDRNPIDDSERVVILLVADSGVSSHGDRITFVARCQSNETEAYINWNDYLGDDSYDVYDEWKNVTIRIGNEQAERQRWGLSTDKQATFAPNWSGDLLKRMTTANTFLAQTTPYNESPVTATFDTSGMRAALTPLAEACRWEIPPES